MILKTTTNLYDSFYRGSEYTLRAQILDENGVPFDLTGSVIKLLFHTLEKSGQIIDAPTGRVQFAFNPIDTKDIMPRAYDITITVDSWVALQGRLGILETNL